MPISPELFPPQQAIEPSARAAQLKPAPLSSIVNPFVVGLTRTGATRTTLVPSPALALQHQIVPSLFRAQLVSVPVLTDATPDARPATCLGVKVPGPLPEPSWP